MVTSQYFSLTPHLSTGNMLHNIQFRQALFATAQSLHILLKNVTLQIQNHVRPQVLGTTRRLIYRLWVQRNQLPKHSQSFIHHGQLWVTSSEVQETPTARRHPTITCPSPTLSFTKSCQDSLEINNAAQNTPPPKPLTNPLVRHANLDEYSIEISTHYSTARKLSQKRSGKQSESNDRDRQVI